MEEVNEEVNEDAKEEAPERPSFEELGMAFDKQFAALKDVLPNLSKKSMQRVFLKAIGHPLKDDEVSLVQDGEQAIYELAVNIKQLEINMMLESLTNLHKEETQKMVDNIKQNPEEEIQRIKSEIDDEIAKD